MSLSFQHVSFGYDQATSRLFEDVTVHLERGWTGIIGANGTGKTTFMKLAAGLLQPQQGRIKRIGQLVFCEQRTDDAPEQLPSFLASMEADVCVLRGKLQIGEDWAERWPTLSHGERNAPKSPSPSDYTRISFCWMNRPTTSTSRPASCWWMHCVPSTDSDCW